MYAWIHLEGPEDTVTKGQTMNVYLLTILVSTACGFVGGVLSRYFDKD